MCPLEYCLSVRFTKPIFLWLKQSFQRIISVHNIQCKSFHPKCMEGVASDRLRTARCGVLRAYLVTEAVRRIEKMVEVVSHRPRLMSNLLIRQYIRWLLLGSTMFSKFRPEVDFVCGILRLWSEILLKIWRHGLKKTF